MLAVAVGAVPAQAGIVSPEDASELAQTLAEAQEDQDVCYGWNVTNNFSTSSATSGPRRAGRASRSPRRRARARRARSSSKATSSYSCGSCESSDSASVSISSGNLANPPTVDDLEDMGLKAGDLTGDNDDTTLVNMVNALPLLVADRGNAPYVEYEQTTTVPVGDHATDKPGSDLLRESWLGLVFFGGLVLAGPGFFLYKRSQRPPPPQEHDALYVPPEQPPAVPAAEAESPGADPPPSEPPPSRPPPPAT